MYITIKNLISVALFIIFFAGLQGGYYYFENRLQELGLLLVLILFLYTTVITGLTIKRPDFQWSWWVFATLLFIGYTLIIPAQRFSANTNMPIIPSILASREFLITFLCPTLYFLYRLGFEVERIEKIFVLALVTLIINYIFNYHRIDLEKAYFSSNHAIAGMVTYDPWRGYRLKPPSMAFFLLSVLAPMLVFMKITVSTKIRWLAICALLVYIWTLVLARSMGLSLLAAIAAYHLFFARKIRLGFFLLVLPFASVLIVSGIQTGIEELSKLDPETDGVRYKSGSLAWNSFLENPIFGFGQQSFYSLTEQSIFWYKFYSSDLGLLGILFKYGSVGAIVYISFSLFLIKRMIATNWAFKQIYGKINPVIFALLIVYLAFTINILLVPAYIFIQGLTAASFGIALTSIWRHKLTQPSTHAELRQLAKPKTLAGVHRAFFNKKVSNI
ncbi:MAG: hypothetical protein RLZZ352_30 [Pseudomonadota bacterium]